MSGASSSSSTMGEGDEVIHSQTRITDFFATLDPAQTQVALSDAADAEMSDAASVHEDTDVSMDSIDEPPAVLESFPFCHLLAELRRLVIDKVREEAMMLPRLVHCAMPLLEDPESHECCQGCGNPTGRWGVSRDLWNLSLTCRDMRKYVTPLIFKDVAFSSKIYQPGTGLCISSVSTYLLKSKPEYITKLTLAIDDRYGIASQVQHLVKLTPSLPALTCLEVGIVLGDTAPYSTNPGGAEVLLAFVWWQYITYPGKIAVWCYNEDDEGLSDAIDSQFWEAEARRRRVVAGFKPAFININPNTFDLDEHFPVERD